MNRGVPDSSVAGRRAEVARIAVVAAMRVELAPLLRRCRIEREVSLDGCRAHYGALHSTPVVLAHTGEGRERAERGAAALLGRFPVAAMLVVGVSGGLSPALAAGSLIAAREVTDRGAAAPPPDAQWLDRALRFEGVQGATVLSSDTILCTPADKRKALATLGSEGPAAVDLESAAFARTAASFGVGYLVLRAVCDASDEELPFDLNDYRDASGRIDRIRVASRAVTRPSSVAGLWKLRGRVARCASDLAGMVEALLEREPV